VEHLILGIGTDLTNIERIQRTLNRHGDRFIDRVFSQSEREKAISSKNQASSYAKRWAAKEALSKALGTGLKMGITWRDMSVSNLETGQPNISVSGQAKKHLRKLTQVGQVATIHLSLTDDYPWAQAFVIIESSSLS
jgi:holo-[acyl-carrier protein] synthase